MGGVYGTIATIMHALTWNAERLCSPTLARLLERDEATASVTQATDYLDKIFRDPQLQKNALNRWTKLMQGTTPFSTFYAEFERLLAEAGGETFDNLITMAQLQGATSPEIVKLGLAAADDCATLQDLANLYRKISVGLVGMKGPCTVYATPYAATTSATAAKTAAAAATAPVYSDPMDIDIPGSFAAPVSASALAPARNSTRVNPNGAPGPGLPTDERLRGRTAKWVPQEESARRRASGACLRCGRLGCRIAVCPLAAACRLTTAAPTSASVYTTYTEPDLDDVVAPTAMSKN